MICDHFFTFNGLVNWSLVPHQYSNAHKFYVHRIFFITFYCVAFKVAIWNSCRIKMWLSAIMHLSVLHCFQGLDQWLRDVPIKHGNREHRRLFCTLWFLCEIIGILLAFGAVSPQSLYTGHIAHIFFFSFLIKISLGHQISETLKYEVIFLC